MKKILLVGSQHGNEKLGDQLYSYIRTRHGDLLDNINYIVANPKAHASGQRYIESDMNRSYSKDMTTYESGLALRLLNTIRTAGYDLILDLHTTRCIQPASLIVDSPNSEVQAFISGSTIDRVVYMKPEIARSSLIGQCSSVVSIEFQDDTVTPLVLEGLADDIRRYITSDRIELHRQFFKVTDYLRKDEISSSQAAKLENFVESGDSYYPILVGENSYKKQTDYLGFKAAKIDN